MTVKQVKEQLEEIADSIDEELEWLASIDEDTTKEYMQLLDITVALHQLIDPEV